jgi:hypothetical protein
LEIKKYAQGPELLIIEVILKNCPRKNTFFEIFSSISWGLCTGTKCEKVVLFGFSTGTQSEKLNFYFKYSKFTFNTDAKSEKYHFFVFGTGTKTPKNR